MDAIRTACLLFDVAGEDGSSDDRIRATDVRCTPHDAVACPDAGIIKNVRRNEPAGHVIELGPPPFREKRTIRECRLNGEEQDQEAGENASMFEEPRSRAAKILPHVRKHFIFTMPACSHSRGARIARARRVHVWPARVRQTVLQVLEHFLHSVHVQGCTLISNHCTLQISTKTVAASTAPCTSEAMSV